MAAKVDVEIQGAEKLDRFFAALKTEARGPAVQQLMGDLAQPAISAIRAHVPKPGYPGDKPGLKPLRDTIGFVVRIYFNSVVVIIGPMRPAGAHGYNVDQGHWSVNRVRQIEGAEFMQAGISQARGEMDNALVSSLRRMFRMTERLFLR